MAKKSESSKFNEVFYRMFDFVSGNVRYRADMPNGYKVKNKKEVREACCHIMLKETGKAGTVSEPKLMIEDNDVEGTSHCLICDRTFATPDINLDNLKILQDAAGVVNGALMLFPWSNIKKSDAQLAIECRNALEKFCILYENAINDIATTRVSNTDTTIKSHVSRLDR